MTDGFGDAELRPREYGSLTLKAGRMYHLCQESEIQEPWNVVALAVCSFEQMHTKDGWEYILSNRVDIENIAWVFENSNSQEEFREKLLELKERELKHRLGEE